MSRFERYVEPYAGVWLKDQQTREWVWKPGERHSVFLIKDVFGKGYVARFIGSHQDRGTCKPVFPDGLEIPEGITDQQGIKGVVERSVEGVWVFMPEGMVLTPPPRK